MPYFDERTYEIGDIARRENLLQRYAIEFYDKMVQNENLYPRKVVNAVKRAIAIGTYNEILMLPYLRGGRCLLFL